MNGRFSIALGFLALIFVGAILLYMPWARASGEFGDLASSLFTACSAVCVTGLTVVDIGSEFSRAGQIAILVLVEIGCLGLMTSGTFLLILLPTLLLRLLTFGGTLLVFRLSIGNLALQFPKGILCHTDDTHHTSSQTVDIPAEVTGHAVEGTILYSSLNPLTHAVSSIVDQIL